MLTESILISTNGKHPSLVLSKKDGTYELKGDLRFRAFYNEPEGVLIIDPEDAYSAMDNLIADKYVIRITIQENFPETLPQVYEIGGRLKEIQTKRNIVDIRDLHVNKEGNFSACLCPRPAEKKIIREGATLQDFLDRLVIPYFYGLSFFEKYGRWSWGEYGHGDAGIFEYYFRQRNGFDIELLKEAFSALGQNGRKIVKNGLKGHVPCLCGSGNKIRGCHAEVLFGAWALNKDYEILQKMMCGMSLESIRELGIDVILIKNNNR
jgi:hypothetical protein